MMSQTVMMSETAMMSETVMMMMSEFVWSMSESAELSLSCEVGEQSWLTEKLSVIGFQKSGVRSRAINVYFALLLNGDGEMWTIRFDDRRRLLLDVDVSERTVFITVSQM